MGTIQFIYSAALLAGFSYALVSLPPVIEALSGLDLQKLLAELPKLGEKLKSTLPETK